jgi:hypothetical protein
MKATKDLNIKSSGRFPSVLGVVTGEWLGVNSGSLSVVYGHSSQSTEVLIAVFDDHRRAVITHLVRTKTFDVDAGWR